MDDNRIEEIDDESINTKIEKKNKEKILYYTNPNDSLEKHKKKSLIFGIIILATTIIIFISEFFYKFGIDYILDYYVSLSMFIDMYVGIVYISRYFRLKDKVEANHFLNLVNVKQIEENNELKYKRTISVSRILTVLSIPLNVTLLTMYFMIINWDINDYNLFEKTICYITTVLVVFVSILVIISNVMIEGEEEIYSDKKIS